MKLLQETIDKEFSLPKHKAKGTAPEKQSVVSQKPLRNSTKQSNLDHLHHNQESDLDPLKTHTSLGQHTNTKNADLDPLKNTQHFSAKHTKVFVQQKQGLHLLQNEI